jgi:hypothetical protein
VILFASGIVILFARGIVIRSANVQEAGASAGSGNVIRSANVREAGASSIFSTAGSHEVKSKSEGCCVAIASRIASEDGKAGPGNVDMRSEEVRSAYGLRLSERGGSVRSGKEGGSCSGSLVVRRL